MISGGLETLITANYVLYYFFPLPVPLPRVFPWSWWISAIIGMAIAIPAGWLMLRGMKDAGQETMMPDKAHRMYGGIYQKIRHPQAMGEVWFFFVVAFVLNSPFLVIYSLIYLPIFVIMCRAEEQDLLLRYGQDYADYCRRVPPFLPRRKVNHE